MATKTSKKLKVSYTFEEKKSLIDNETAFKTAVTAVFTKLFEIPKEAAADKPVEIIKLVAEDLAEVIAAYIQTAKITIPKNLVITNVNTTGDATAQAGTGKNNAAIEIVQEVGVGGLS